MAKTGRPSTYTPEIAAIICDRISRGESLKAICNSPGIPDQVVVYGWLGRQPEFAQMYARAREDQADTLADEIAALADEEPRMVVDDKGVARIDSAWVQWQKNRVEARKWVAAKLKPKKWGERIQVAGDADSPLKLDAEINAEKLFKTILEHAQLTRQAAGS
jgi:hypothetical protein